MAIHGNPDVRNNNMGFQGFSGHSIKSLRKYYSVSNWARIGPLYQIIDTAYEYAYGNGTHLLQIFPLYGLIGTAVTVGVFMGLRTLFKNPEVIVDHSHSHPWDDYRDKQYKVIHFSN